MRARARRGGRRGGRLRTGALGARGDEEEALRERCCRVLLARAAEAEHLGLPRVARAMVRDAAALEVSVDRRLACEVARSMLRHGVSVADLDE